MFLETGTVAVFRDIDPQAPEHFLIIPKKHIPTFNDVTRDDGDLLADMLFASKELASKLGVKENGYRIVANCNEYGGQEVFHIHFHFLAGRRLKWPPG
jgi:histidine triad (HIT) family protein